MLGKEYSFQQKITKLREREKELKCLYRVEEVIRKDLPFDAFFYEIIRVIPNGWQHPESCRAKITYSGEVYKEPGWQETEWKQEADIEIDEEIMGKMEVFYTRFTKMHVDSPFLPEEFKLLHTIASLVSHYIFSKKLSNTLQVLKSKSREVPDSNSGILTNVSDMHWKWRYSMVEAIANKLDFDRFGIKGLYLIGSTKEATAGPASDIDLLLHIKNGETDRKGLNAWLEGWSLCLSEINFHRTGYKTDGLIDVHLITDEDISNKTSYAVMIGAASNSAKPIKTEY